MVVILALALQWAGAMVVALRLISPQSASATLEARAFGAPD